MAKQRKEIHKVVMIDGKRAIIKQLFQEYNVEKTNDMQDVLKNLLGGTIKEMMESEMDEHLGYSKSECSHSENARNGYKQKQMNSSYGSFQIDVPQDRQSSFNGITYASLLIYLIVKLSAIALVSIKMRNWYMMPSQL
jgi:transposase-like protein